MGTPELKQEMVQQKSTTQLMEGVEAVQIKMDGYFIGGMVCVALGVALIIIAIAYLTTYCCRVRQTKRQERLRRRHLEHMRYLEEYSIKAGDSPNEHIKHNNNTVSVTEDDVFKWDTSQLVNLGYVSDDTLERLSQKGPKLDAHMNGSSSLFSNQRPQSRAGSTSSRPSSLTSLADSSVGGSSSGRNRRSGSSESKRRSSASLGDVSKTSVPDRLADVPV